MPALTTQTAARIAKAAGLQMSDAAALMQLADTEDQAEALAAQFAADGPTPGELAEAVERQLGKR